MKRCASALLFGTLLSACSLDTFQPVHTKVNAAFPVSAEVRVTLEKLHDALRADKATLKDIDQRYAARLELRARQCAVDANIGRMDPVEKIRALPLDKDCFNREDQQLQQLLGMRLVGLYLSMPALYPMRPLGQAATLPNPGGESINSVETAAAAGVAVIFSGRGEYTSIRFPEGNKLASLPLPAGMANQLVLSPNGRLVVVRKRDEGLQFISTENGNVLYETREGTHFLAWLPDLSAALVNGNKNSQLMLMDFQQSRMEAHPLGINQQRWALPVKPGGELLVGGPQALVHVKHQREQGNLTASRVREYPQPQGRYVSGSPWLMRDGRAVLYSVQNEVVVLDLESGKEAVWQTSAALMSNFAKLNESSVLTNALILGDGPLRTRGSVIDIDQATIAPVEDGTGAQGAIAGLVGRSGFLRRVSGGIQVGDQVASGKPEPLESFLAAANLKRQLASLEESAAQSPAAPPSAAAVPGPSVDLNLPSNARVEAVGVYQGSGAKHGPGMHPMGQIDVVIKRSAQPLVLVLSSYEPVSWNLKPEPGAQPVAVLLSGYHPSQVNNSGRVRVLRTGTSHAYQLDSSEYVRLKRDVQAWTGKTIAMFQGSYEGANFTVGQ